MAGCKECDFKGWIPLYFDVRDRKKAPLMESEFHNLKVLSKNKINAYLDLKYPNGFPTTFVYDAIRASESKDQKDKELKEIIDAIKSDSEMTRFYCLSL